MTAFLLGCAVGLAAPPIEVSGQEAPLGRTGSPSPKRPFHHSLWDYLAPGLDNLQRTLLRNVGLSPSQRAECEAYVRQYADGVSLRRRGDDRRAIALIRVAVDGLARLKMRGHIAYGTGLRALADLYAQDGEPVQALVFARRGVALARESWGEHHPRYARALERSAEAEAGVGTSVEAFRQRGEALAIRRSWRRFDPAGYAMGLGRLGELCLEVGDLIRAEPALTEARQVWLTVPPPRPAAYAECLAALGSYYEAIPDPALAREYFRQSLDEWAQAGGRTLSSADLCKVAMLHLKLGETDEAGRALDAAITRAGARPGGRLQQIEARRLYALYLSAKSDHGPACRSLEELRESIKSGWEKQSKRFADLTFLEGLECRAAHGRQRPEELFARAYEMYFQLFGPDHPDCVASRFELAVEQAQDDPDGATVRMRTALDAARENVGRTFAVLSERQQLILITRWRSRLEAYLTLALRTGQPDEVIYSQVLAWKGAVFGRQRLIRLARKRPDLRDKFEELQRNHSQIEALSRAEPASGPLTAWRQELKALIDRSEALETELSGVVEYASERAAMRRTPAQVRDALGDDTALIDFFEYVPAEHPPGGAAPAVPNPSPQLVAFVVRKDRQVAMIRLGLSITIGQVIDRWLSANASQFPGGGAGGPDPGAELRVRLWGPLEAHLGDIGAVLVAPEGDLTRIPLAALPGQTTGSYLAQERKIVVVPVPQLLVPKGGADVTLALDSLLLVGDVNYDADPDPPSSRGPREPSTPLPITPAVPRGSRPLPFPALPATQDEIDGVAAIYSSNHPRGVVNRVLGGMATEGALRKQASGNRFLHLATHGYFATMSQKSALDQAFRVDPGLAMAAGLRGSLDRFELRPGYQPGLLSGIALAGANRGARWSPGSVPSDDGILTASEVAQADLSRTELVVLSACETGLGRAAGGEGVLGLQRAFQVAGAGSLVVSLWKVEDVASRVFMTQFSPKPVGRAPPLARSALACTDGDDRALTSQRSAACSTGSGRPRSARSTGPRSSSRGRTTIEPGAARPGADGPGERGRFVGVEYHVELPHDHSQATAVTCIGRMAHRPPDRGRLFVAGRCGG